VVSSYPHTNLVNANGVAVHGWVAQGGLNFNWFSGAFTVWAICVAP
jgi:hypothetical protein